ncbi:MAG: hypothetical protein LBT26_01990 [Clostridiales Family XIII bacterium]|jgi:RHS repeat-associated protein|nr:hypothetical protein [Clostridiales Family XIII bacterium]
MGQVLRPETRRFTQEDPVKDGSNWYVYVADSPVNFVDPWGKNEQAK